MQYLFTFPSNSSCIKLITCILIELEKSACTVSLSSSGTESGKLDRLVETVACAVNLPVKGRIEVIVAIFIVLENNIYIFPGPHRPAWCDLVGAAERRGL